MKSFIEPRVADCSRVTGYTLAGKLFSNTGERFLTKAIFIFLYNCQPIARRLSPCYYKTLSFSIFLMLLMPAIQAQQDLNYAVHANIIYRFTKYIDWPNYNNSGNFIIGIVGDTPLYSELEGFIANKTVGHRKIVVKKFSPSAAYYNCQILFISEDKAKNLKKIAAVTKGSPILIVSETSNNVLSGSCINFVVVNEHLKLEINKTNLEDRNLNIASELLGLGTVVK